MRKLDANTLEAATEKTPYLGVKQFGDSRRPIRKQARGRRPRCCAAGKDSGCCSQSPVRDGSHMPRKSQWTWDRHDDISPRGYGEAQARGGIGSGTRTGVQIQTTKESATHPAQRVNQSVTVKILLERLGHHMLPLWDTARQFFTKPHAPCDPAVTPLYDPSWQSCPK